MRNIRAKAGDGTVGRVARSTTHDHSPPHDCICPFCHIISNKRERQANLVQMVKFNKSCGKVPNTKDARLDITAKLLSLGLDTVDILADGNCFLHAVRFALLQLKNWNLKLVPTVATIRSDVVGFLTNARLNVIMDGRRLDEVRGGMKDAEALGRQRTSQ